MVVKQTCNYCHNIAINWVGEITWWTEKLFYILLRFSSTIFPLFRPAITHLWIFEYEDSECLLGTFVSTNCNFFTPASEGYNIFHLLSHCQSTVIYIALSQWQRWVSGCPLKTGNIISWDPHYCPEMSPCHAGVVGHNWRWECHFFSSRQWQSTHSQTVKLTQPNSMAVAHVVHVF